jgi:ABC-2 type transport system permease protein
MNRPLPRPRSLALELQTLAAMARKELLIMIRYPVEFVASFGQIFLIVAIFTLASLTFTPASPAAGESHLSGLIVYGFILFMFVSDTIWTLGYEVRQEQVQGTLEQLYLTPANKMANLMARVITILVWTTLLVVAAILLMTLLVGRLPFHNGLLGGYLLVMALLGTFGMGFAFAALALRIKEAAQTVAIMLQFVFLILCAIFFPFSTLPPAVRFLSRLIPFSYAVDAFRSTLMDYPAGFPELAPIEVEIVIVSAFALVMPVAGYRLYRWAENRARMTGSLSAY